MASAQACQTSPTGRPVYRMTKLADNHGLTRKADGDPLSHKSVIA